MKVLFFVVLLFATSLGFADSNLDVQLQDAVSRADVTAVQNLLAAGANPNNTDIDGKDCRGEPAKRAPAIVVASGFDTTNAILKMILDHGGDVNVRSKSTDCIGGVQDGRTPLLEAVKWQPAIQNIKLLLNRGADANALSVQWKDSSLSLAMGRNSQAAIDLLWPYLNLPTLTDGYLHLFHQSYESSLIQLYFDKFIASGVDINSADAQGQTLLSAAMRADTSAFISKLFSLGATIPKNIFPYRIIIGERVPEPAQKASILLAHGARPTLTDLAVVSSGSAFDVADVILGSGLDINGSENGRPLLYLQLNLPDQNPMVNFLHSDSLNYLVGKGLNLNFYFNDSTPLLSLIKAYQDDTAIAALKGGCEAQ